MAKNVGLLSHLDVIREDKESDVIPTPAELWRHLHGVHLTHKRAVGWQQVGLHAIITNLLHYSACIGSTKNC